MYVTTGRLTKNMMAQENNAFTKTTDSHDLYVAMPTIAR
jgi:hypothetical protein